MNKKHMSWLIVFGFAVVSTLLVFVKGLYAESAVCILYNITACFSALVWGGNISAEKKHVAATQGFVWHCLIWFAVLESVVTLAA